MTSSTVLCAVSIAVAALLRTSSLLLLPSCTALPEEGSLALLPSKSVQHETVREENVDSALSTKRRERLISSCHLQGWPSTIRRGEDSGERDTEDDEENASLSPSSCCSAEKAMVIPRGVTAPPICAGSIIGDYQLTERTASLGLFGHSTENEGEDKNGEAWCATEFEEGQEEVCQLQKTLPSASEQASLEYQETAESMVFVKRGYKLGGKFNRGSHGEVWRAQKIGDEGGYSGGRGFVLKRIFLELGEHIHQSGLREIHFGKLLRKEPHVARYVEHFYRDVVVTRTQEESPSGRGPVDGDVTQGPITQEERDGQGLAQEQVAKELWLVFHDEGTSLRSLLYDMTEADGSIVYQPSVFWRRMRTEEEGEDVMKEMMRQLLEGLAALHESNVTHRDIKPSNILVNDDHIPATVKLADFGSAIDSYSLRHLYDYMGPSQAEETKEYQPPEVLFDPTLPYHYPRPSTYDVWSVGVVFLEIIFGTSSVFRISGRRRAELERELRLADDEVRQKTYLLYALSEFCIYSPTDLEHSTERYALVRSRCSLADFHQHLIARDPIGTGLRDHWGVHLLYRLLQWTPENRISIRDALQHAYFQGPYVCNLTGRSFALPEDLRAFQEYLEAKSEMEEARDIPVMHQEPEVEYYCPKCGRAFSLWHSCDLHVKLRNHSRFCSYDVESLPLPVSAFPSAPFIGAFDLKGRKPYMEDVFYHEAFLGYDIFYIFDGHMGSTAANFLKENLPALLHRHLTQTRESSLQMDLVLRQVFWEVNNQFLSESPESDISGSTATVVLRKGDFIIAANVGDSRAILCCDHRGEPIQLTVDHVPDHPLEKRRIELSGGFIEHHGVWRVVGVLAVSRTIGDRTFRQYLSSEPHVAHYRLGKTHRYLIIASDGLWDGLSNADAVGLVDEEFDSCTKFALGCAQKAAQRLAYESFVRGTTDNIATMVWDLR